MRNNRDPNKERREYYGDVTYEIWRRGGNPDEIDYDRLDDYCYEGLYSAEAATLELRRQRSRGRMEE
ncbi:MAG: hypothetical protein WC364_12850 [Eubacteriales bacterium]|jgi:hypothetical protein